MLDRGRAKAKRRRPAHPRFFRPRGDTLGRLDEQELIPTEGPDHQRNHGGVELRPLALLGRTFFVKGPKRTG
jgi:hypothetical protein